MGKQNVNEYDKSYHPPETIKLDYCAAVLAVVLEQHPKAKGLYENIKEGATHYRVAPIIRLAGILALSALRIALSIIGKS